MKKLLTLGAVSLSCFAASAQTANFEGFSAALNLNLVGASTKTKLDSAGPALDGLGTNTAAASVQAAYGFAVSNNAVVSIGGTYVLGSPKVFSLDDGSNSVNGKAKSESSIYVEPGYLLSDKTMVYGKLSYESANLNADSASSHVSKGIRGTGFGAGLRTMIDKNMFVQVEVKQVGYGSARFDGATGDFKTSSTMGTVGVGYKF